MGVALLHTGRKLATHSHLKQLHDLSSMAGLEDLAGFGYNAIQNGDRSAFLHMIHRAAQQLRERGLVAPWTGHLLASLQQQPFTLAAKGCGAMGADVLLLCYPLVERQHVIAWAQSNQLPIIAIHALAEEGYAAE